MPQTEMLSYRYRYHLVGLALLLFFGGLLMWQIGSVTDAEISAALRLSSTSSMAPLVISFSWLGGATVMIPLGMAGVACLAERGWYARALWLALVIASGRLFVEETKILFDRPRPAYAQQLVSVGSASFPSSHSAGSALTCAALIIAFEGGRRAQAAAVAWASAIGLSRVMLGVHWPSDVLAGWGIGLCWAVGWSSRMPARKLG